MYSLSVNGQFLDLGSTALNITMINPIFDRDSILRIFSYPFNIEATARNKHIFEHADRLDSLSSNAKYEARVYLNGQRFETGVLTISSTTEKNFRLVFKGKALELIEELKLLELQNLEWPFTIPYDFSPHYLFDLYLPVPLGDTTHQAIQINEHIFKVIAGNHQELIDQINEVYPGMAQFFSSTINTFSMIISSIDATQPLYINVNLDIENCALFYLNTDTNLSTERASEKIQETWTTHLEAIIGNPSSHVFPVFKNEGFFGDREAFQTGEVSFYGHLNYYAPEEKYLFNTIPQEEKNWRYSLVPFPFLKATLDKVAASSSIDNFEGSFIEDQEIQQLLIANNRTLDHLIQESYEPEDSGGWLNVWQLEYALQNHLPQMSAYDLLIDLSSTFCLVYDYQDGHFEMATCRERLAAPVEDWTHLAEAEYKQIPTTNAGYILDYERQGEETTFEDQLEKVDQSKLSTAQEFVSNFYTFFSKREIDLPSFVRSWRIPFINEEGNSSAIEMVNDISKRLIFYRGMQADLAGNLYPFASAYTQNTNEEEIANYSLDWQGEKGLFNQWWKAYIELVTKGKPVTKNLRLSINEILDLKKFDRIRKRIWHRKGQINGVVKQVQFRAYPDRKELGIAKVEFVTQ